MLVSVVHTSSRVLSRIFSFLGGGAGGGDFEPHGGEKTFLGFLEGSEGMLPQIVFRIG